MKFAIIMPVYNKAPFVQIAIQSILRQTYNLEQTIQLILVNDGSTDGSDVICEKYAQKHPEQITYVKTDNRGPAAARNYGCTFVEKDVEMVGFVDADDFLGINAVQQVEKFLQKNDVNMVVLPIRYFNSNRIGSEHSLNYRFRGGDKVINLNDAFDAIHLYAGGLFLKKNTLEAHAPFFEESLQFWEDAFSINRYLLTEFAYGVVADTYYYYRKGEETNESVVDEFWQEKERYMPLIENGYKALMDQSNELHGKVLPFIQYLIVFHLKLYMFKRNYDVMKETLTEAELQAFIHAVEETLAHIDERYIQAQRMKLYIKSFLLSLKRDGWPITFTMEKADLSKETVVIKSKTPTLKGLKIRAYLSERADLLRPDDTVYIMSGAQKILCKKINDGEEVKIWDVPTGVIAGIEFEAIVPYHALKFTYYVQRGTVIVALGTFNYYKRATRKALPDMKWFK